MKTYVVKIYEVDKKPLKPEIKKDDLINALNIFINPNDEKRVELVYSQIFESKSGEVIDKIVKAINDSKMKEIKWIPINDGFGIVGYGWFCPKCDNWVIFGEYYEDYIKCKKCENIFKNPGDPDDM